MVSTTWVQFLKGSLLVVFSALLTWMILERGFKVEPVPEESQTVTKTADGQTLVNGAPKGTEPGENSLRPVGTLSKLPDGKTETGPLGPLEFFSVLQKVKSSCGQRARKSQMTAP